METVRRTIAGGGRVVAVGTSVVRALESASYGLSGFTSLKLGPGYERKIVDGPLTGAHGVSESHYRPLRAFLPKPTLATVSQRLYLAHEFGDLCMILT